jgi:hypothetical protein
VAKFRDEVWSEHFGTYWIKGEDGIEQMNISEGELLDLLMHETDHAKYVTRQCTEAEAREFIEKRKRNVTWRIDLTHKPSNSIIYYKVVAQVLEVGDGVCLNEQFNGTVWLSIRANNGMTVERDWRDYQAIKNDLVSPDRQAIEIYPKESKLVDTVNVFHLWVLPEDIEIPVGYQYRDVDYTRADQRECLNANEEK